MLRVANIRSSWLIDFYSPFHSRLCLFLLCICPYVVLIKWTLAALLVNQQKPLPSSGTSGAQEGLFLMSSNINSQNSKVIQKEKKMRKRQESLSCIRTVHRTPFRSYHTTFFTRTQLLSSQLFTALDRLHFNTRIFFWISLQPSPNSWEFPYSQYK